jgi:hypothetical protein
MDDHLRVVTVRRVDDWRGLRRLTHGRPAYEVGMSDDSRRRVSLRELDNLVDGRRYPADFWACVRAVDEARATGDDATHIWPSGERQQSP